MENENKGSHSNGMELLEKVIKSNLDNIEHNVKLRFEIDDLKTSLNEVQFGLKDSNLISDEILTSFKLENIKRKEFLNSIPVKIETVPSQETIDYYEGFQEKIKIMKRFAWAGIVILIFAVLMMIVTVNFANNFYRESIKSKSEIREEIMKEIADKGQNIYDENEIKILNNNTSVMQKWMKKYPKEAEKFQRFKDGYEAREDTIP
ncbi:hypothetical protein [Chryseobacterium gambrini]|uniref:hypothetical protein n=1 Tax=Chryseobacterium gambrini TaxID=373672 RepID=UPI0022F16416|nr:hypothetical protein [Chryseobacterium gambrini]WBV54137.1 hypothetical protein PFY09_07345 [Chryseobacterium gambrini]